MLSTAPRPKLAVEIIVEKHYFFFLNVYIYKCGR